MLERKVLKKKVKKFSNIGTYAGNTPQRTYGTPTTHPRTADPVEDQIPDLNRYSFLDQNFNHLKDKQVTAKTKCK